MDRRVVDLAIVVESRAPYLIYYYFKETEITFLYKNLPNKNLPEDQELLDQSTQVSK